jgi:hypothetical protein
VALIEGVGRFLLLYSRRSGPDRAISPLRRAVRTAPQYEAPRGLESPACVLQRDGERYGFCSRMPDRLMVMAVAFCQSPALTVSVQFVYGVGAR